jgi:hypothetical protein
MGVVLQFPSARIQNEPALSKRQLAMYLGRSTRWIELRYAEGAPSFMDGHRRMSYPSEFVAWLDSERYARG